MARDDVRFHRGDMHSVLVNQLKKAEEDVLGVPADYVLVMSVEDLVDELFARWVVNPLVVHFDQRSSSGTKDIDFYVAGWEGDRIKVAGSCIKFLYPFEGDAVLFDVRPSTGTMNPPRFELRDGFVLVAYEGRAPLDPNAVKSYVDSMEETIRKYVGWSRNDIDPWNERLRVELRRWVEERRTKVIADRALDAFLEVPVVDRANPSPSFTVDPPRKVRPVAVQPIAPTPAFAPEPAISDDGFAAILREIESVTTAVQRLPKTFAKMPEESLRDVLLVVLNNHFGPATGETFSRRGKTDIFIPYGGDERAVFIAECKVWKGQKAFEDAIDQLLGYLIWRDSRAALIVFVRAGSPTDIGTKAIDAIRRHESFKRMGSSAGRETFTLANRNDDRKEIHLALLVVPVIE